MRTIAWPRRRTTARLISFVGLIAIVVILPAIIVGSVWSQSLRGGSNTDEPRTLVVLSKDLTLRAGENLTFVPDCNITTLSGGTPAGVSYALDLTLDATQLISLNGKAVSAVVWHDAPERVESGWSAKNDSSALDGRAPVVRHNVQCGHGAWPSLGFEAWVTFTDGSTAVLSSTLRIG